MRTAVTMGLHVDVPASQLGDPAIREHRVRVWWTAYILDRMCAVKLTQPVSIADDAVETELPADRGLSDVDFEDPQILIANVKLAKHASEVITSVYRRRKQDTPFSLRVQKVVRDLWHWVEELPDHLKIDKTAVSGTSSRTVVRLHLSFNQVRNDYSFMQMTLISNMILYIEVEAQHSASKLLIRCSVLFLQHDLCYFT